MIWWRMSILLLLLFTCVSRCPANVLHLTIEENSENMRNPIGNVVTLIQNQTNNANPVFTAILITKADMIGHRNFIKIDEKSGDIYLLSPVDREEICSRSDKCTEATFIEYIISADKVYDLRIEVIDVNDNTPLFQPDEKNIKIPEDINKFEKYSLPIARDLDSAKFSVKRYELKSQNQLFEGYFKLENESSSKPMLQIIGNLDRESIQRFEFDLWAIDGGGLSGKCRIDIEITDINDNTPQWIGLPYRRQIKECTTDNRVLELLVEDKDDPLTEGGQVKFKISENSPNPELVSRSFYVSDKILYLNSNGLKAFNKRQVEITIIATDGGGRTNETTVTLDVIDCNDHSPQISLDKRTLQVVENEQKEKVVAKVTVEDKDVGDNSDFTCYINDTSRLWLNQIYTSSQKESGTTKIYHLLTVKGISFDREELPRYSVQITCRDNGQQPMSSSDIVTVYVIDENDNPPKFPLDYRTFSILENATLGSEVGKIVATDRDASPNDVITYRIVGDSSVERTFSINAYGQIQLTHSLDREQQDRFEFQVIAVDSGSAALNDSCQVKVIVLDVNDCAPKIAKEHRFDIVESENENPTHKNFGKLEAEDFDSGDNGKVTFKIRSRKPPTCPVRITEDGKLSIYGVIDREKYEVIEAQIDVVDRGSPSLTTVTTIYIDVLDVNDNSPRFNFSSGSHQYNYINISNDPSPGTMIGRVYAVDLDKGENGSVEYRIVGSPSQIARYSVMPDGQIIINEKPNRKPGQEQVSVEASDKGTPRRRTTSTLYFNYIQSTRDEQNNLHSNQNNMPDSKKGGYPLSKDYQDDNKYPSLNWTNSKTLIIFLVMGLIIVFIAAFLVLVIYCKTNIIRRSGEHPSKTIHQRDSANSSYQKGNTKADKSGQLKTDSSMNNEFTTMRSDAFHDPTMKSQFSNMAVLKRNCTPFDQSYQIAQAATLAKTYSAFQPKCSNLDIESESLEASPFYQDTWGQPRYIESIRPNNENFYDAEQKYSLLHAANVSPLISNPNIHFSTPTSNRRSDQFPIKNDSNQNIVRYHHVSSSFV